MSDKTLADGKFFRVQLVRTQVTEGIVFATSKDAAKEFAMDAAQDWDFEDDDLEVDYISETKLESLRKYEVISVTDEFTDDISSLDGTEAYKVREYFAEHLNAKDEEDEEDEEEEKEKEEEKTQ